MIQPNLTAIHSKRLIPSGRDKSKGRRLITDVKRVSFNLRRRHRLCKPFQSCRRFSYHPFHKSIHWHGPEPSNHRATPFRTPLPSCPYKQSGIIPDPYRSTIPFSESKSAAYPSSFLPIIQPFFITTSSNSRCGEISMRTEAVRTVRRNTVNGDQHIFVCGRLRHTAVPHKILGLPLIFPEPDVLQTQ